MKTFPKLTVLFALSAYLSGCGHLQESSENTATTVTVSFVSETGQEVRAEYISDKTVKLTFADGSTLILPIAPSGSGARYASAEAEWWEHHGEATYSAAGHAVFTGKLKD